MTQEALKLALEALTYIYTETTADEDELIDQAITAIKEALLAQKQEPIAMLFGSLPVYDYTTPPQRTWVELTEDDRKQIARKANYHWEMTTSEYAERIGELTEAKLKEKNT